MGAGNGNFAAPVNYGVGTQPFGIVVADFNGDNKPDIATANYGSNNVSRLLNSGTGTFGVAANANSGIGATSPWDLTAADVTGDNKPDLIVANYGTYHVGVMVNNGTGTFAIGVDYAGVEPQGPAMADFNGDGNQDIVAGIADYGRLNVLLNRGNGLYSSVQNYAFTGGTYGLTSGDFNGDSKPDIAAVSRNSTAVGVFFEHRFGQAQRRSDLHPERGPLRDQSGRSQPRQPHRLGHGQRRLAYDRLLARHRNRNLWCSDLQNGRQWARCGRDRRLQRRR